MALNNLNVKLQTSNSEKRLGKLTWLNPNDARPGIACRGKMPHKPVWLLYLLNVANDSYVNYKALPRQCLATFDGFQKTD